MTVVMAKTHHDNVSWTLLNESSSFIIPVLDKTFRGSCIGRETRSRRASVTHLARSVAGLKAPISPLPAWSEMGCISDGLSELTTTPVVGFSARKKQYRQPCDLPLTLSDIQKTLEQNRTEQNRTGVPCWQVSWPSRFFLLDGVGEIIPCTPYFTLSLFSHKYLSGLRGIQDMLWVTHFIDVLFLFFREVLTYSSGMGCAVIRSSGLLLSAS